MTEIKINASKIKEALENITNAPSQKRAETVDFLNSILSTDQTGLDLLVSGVKMPDIDIKISSALALGRVSYKSPAAITALQGLIENREENAFVRHSAVAALVNMSSPEATEALVVSIRNLNQEDASFWSFTLRTFAEVGALGLPHLELFEELKTKFANDKYSDGIANINMGRIELSRSIERDFYRFASLTNHSSQPFGAYLDENCELPGPPAHTVKLGEYDIQFDERATFSINPWAYESSKTEADTRIVVLQSVDQTKKPLIVVCHDEMTHNFFLIDALDVAKQISRHLDTKIGDFDWATYSSPTKDNSNYEGSLRIVDYNSPIMILNSLESEFKIGPSYKDISRYLRTMPNPPGGFYHFTVQYRKDLARQSKRIISQGNHF